MRRLKSTCIALFASLTGAVGQTTVSSNIYSSTTWTASGSPYTIANNIVVFAGVTLTIDPGVVVLFDDGVSIDFRGQLIANGTSSNRIFFTSADSLPTQGIYGGFKVTGYSGVSGSITHQIAMSYCNICYASNFMNLIMSCEGPFYFNHCYFYKNYSGIGDSPDCGDLYVDSCKFESNNMGVNQDENAEVYVSNCLFINNTTGTTADFVSNSVFTGNGLGVFAYTSLQDCELYNNTIGAECDVHGGTTVNHNYIHDNIIGVRLDRLATGLGFSQNKVCNNTTWNIEYEANFNADVSNNCFCSTDSTYIRSKLRDGYYDATYGLLTYNIDSSCGAGVTAVNTTPNIQSNSVKVYPNPFSDHAAIDFNYSTGHLYRLEITDELGRKIRSVDHVKAGATINKDDIAPGMYYFPMIY